MNSPPNILIVEDDEDDLFMARRTLNKAGFRNVFHVPDGHEAVDYLAGRGAYGDRATHPLPDVMLVDLKIPKITGHQVVEWAAAQPPLKGIRIFILSSSGEDRDRQRARNAGVMGYLVKPLTTADVARLFETRE